VLGFEKSWGGVLSRKTGLPALLTGILLVFTLAEATLSESDEPKMHACGYVQFLYGSAEESFEVEDVRLFLTGKIGATSPLLELRLDRSDVLVKAQVSWSVCPALGIIVGQQSNPYKYYYPAPQFNPTIRTPYVRFMATADDIGVSAKGCLKPVAYHFCLFNGTGRNVPDDNRYKDVVARIELSPHEIFKLAGCWQGGIQENGWREATALDIFLKPVGFLEVTGAYLHRRDLDEDGWFAMLLCRLGSLEMVSRLSRGEESCVTLGVNTHIDEHLKFQVNWIIPDEGEMELVARCQFSLE
jgi:hypothetical protein